VPNWYVYLLRCRNGALYTGVTTDVARRVALHNRGRGAAYTRLNGPAELVYVEEAEGRGAALQREHEIKRWPKRRKEGLLTSSGNLVPR